MLSTRSLYEQSPKSYAATTGIRAAPCRGQSLVAAPCRLPPPSPSSSFLASFLPSFPLCFLSHRPLHRFDPMSSVVIAQVILQSTRAKRRRSMRLTDTVALSATCALKRSRLFFGVRRHQLVEQIPAAKLIIP